MKLDITRIEQKGAVLYLGRLPDEFVDLYYIDPRFSEIGAGDKEGEGTILRIAYAYEQATDWHKRRPQI